MFSRKGLILFNLCFLFYFVLNTHTGYIQSLQPILASAHGIYSYIKIYFIILSDAADSVTGTGTPVCLSECSSAVTSSATEISTATSPANFTATSTTTLTVTETTASSVKSETFEDVRAIIEELFPEELTNHTVHHHDLCTSRHCTSFSKDETLRQQTVNKEKTKEKLFNHDWLIGKEAHCSVANCFGAVFVEGQGLYCLLCKRHNNCSAQNKAEKFAAVPSTRFKRATLKEHKASKAHKDTIAIHDTQKHSVYHKEEEEKSH